MLWQAATVKTAVSLASQIFKRYTHRWKFLRGESSCSLSEAMKHRWYDGVTLKQASISIYLLSLEYIIDNWALMRAYAEMKSKGHMKWSGCSQRSLGKKQNLKCGFPIIAYVCVIKEWLFHQMSTPPLLQHNYMVKYSVPKYINA